MRSWREIRQSVMGNDSRRDKEQRRAAENSPATRDDMRKLSRELRREKPDRSNSSKAIGKAGRMMKSGFDDVARSMSTTNAPGRRPRISQMPKRGDADIAKTPNADSMKMGGLRGRDIRGRKIR